MHPRPSNPGRARITISMVDEDVIASVARAWHAGYWRRAPDMRKDGSGFNQQQFSAELVGGRAVDLMYTLQPLMGERRSARIAEILHWYERERGTPSAVMSIPARGGEVSELPLDWLAGLLEGEGSFYRETNARNASGIRIKMSMTDEDVVRRVAIMIGGNVYADRRSARNDAHLDYYTTYTSGRRAVALMRWLDPLMGQRRRMQISRALAAR